MQTLQQPVHQPDSCRDMNSDAFFHLVIDALSHVAGNKTNEMGVDCVLLSVFQWAVF